MSVSATSIEMADVQLRWMANSTGALAARSPRARHRDRPRGLSSIQGGIDRSLSGGQWRTILGPSHGPSGPFAQGRSGI